MEKEGTLPYSVALEEVRAAVAEASVSLDKIIEDEPAKGIEAAVAEAPVIYSGNEASYRSDAAELPGNYKDSGGRAADDDDDEPEVKYSQEDYVVEAAKAFDSEIEAELKANTLKISSIHLAPSAEAAERLETYKISIGYAMRFLLYAIKSATF